jgi:hypothetical protein
VRDERGPEFYSEIGQKQGRENNLGNFADRNRIDVREAGERRNSSDDHQRRGGRAGTGRSRLVLPRWGY